MAVDSSADLRANLARDRGVEPPDILERLGLQCVDRFFSSAAPLRAVYIHKCSCLHVLLFTGRRRASTAQVDRSAPPTLWGKLEYGDIHISDTTKVCTS